MHSENFSKQKAGDVVFEERCNYKTDEKLEEVKQASPTSPEQPDEQTAVPKISFAPMNSNLANNPDFQELLSAMQPPLLAQNSDEQQPVAASSAGGQQPPTLGSSSTS